MNKVRLGACLPGWDRAACLCINKITVSNVGIVLYLSPPTLQTQLYASKEWQDPWTARAIRGCQGIEYSLSFQWDIMMEANYFSN